MKKLIVLSVVFALVATAAFAVDLGGVVIGGVNLLDSNTGDDADINGGALMKRIRIEGGGEAGDGKFGGYFRLNHEDMDNGDYGGVSGNAWWKPIDQFKLIVGSNGGDGFYGKEGVTGWMFYQAVSDSGTVVSPGNCWYSDFNDGYAQFRSVFFGGDGGGDALRLEISPIDILGINLVLPYYTGTNSWGGPSNAGKVEDIFKNVIAQIDLKLDFGNIALTYTGSGGTGGGDDNSKLFVYYGGGFGDLNIDFGFSYTLTGDDDVKQPMGVGLGVKYATDSFGVKFRGMGYLGGDDKLTTILADVMPFFSLGDNLTAFVSVGLAMTMPDEGDTVTGWHFNPYLQVGEDWGAKFLVGVRVWSVGGKNASGDDNPINWSVPISVMVNF